MDGMRCRLQCWKKAGADVLLTVARRAGSQLTPLPPRARPSPTLLLRAPPGGLALPARTWTL
jgi:hypothetical protein